MTGSSGKGASFEQEFITRNKENISSEPLLRNFRITLTLKMDSTLKMTK